MNNAGNASVANLISLKEELLKYKARNLLGGVKSKENTLMILAINFLYFSDLKKAKECKSLLGKDFFNSPFELLLQFAETAGKKGFNEESEALYRQLINKAKADLSSILVSIIETDNSYIKKQLVEKILSYKLINKSFIFCIIKASETGVISKKEASKRIRVSFEGFLASPPEIKTAPLFFKYCLALAHLGFVKEAKALFKSGINQHKFNFQPNIAGQIDYLNNTKELEIKFPNWEGYRGLLHSTAIERPRNSSVCLFHGFHSSTLFLFLRIFLQYSRDIGFILYVIDIVSEHQ